MKTLIIYDNEGNIYFRMSGSYLVPQGEIRYLEVDSAIHEDKIIKGVDVEKKELILEDYPKVESESEILHNRINELESYISLLAEQGHISEEEFMEILK